jgi:deoxyribodipyrimidine photo-lyase
VSRHLVWFKRDLRVDDHRPLAEAAALGPTLGLYIYEPDLIQAGDFDASHLVFINQSLSELRDRLRTLGTELLILTGEAVDVLERIRRRCDIQHVWAHEETTQDVGYRRDQRVRAWAKRVGVRFTEYPQFGVVRRLKDRDGWADNWEQRMRQPIHPTPTRIQPVLDPTVSVSELIGLESRLRTPDTFGQTVPPGARQVGGEIKAQECLDSFLVERGENYRSGMSSPVTAYHECSRLSTFLAYGNISMRRVFQTTVQRQSQLARWKSQANRAEDKAAGSDDDAYPPISSAWQQSLVSFQARLRWHCHFMQKMEDQPSIEFENMNSAFDGLREHEFDRTKFEAWCDGRTGYPMVDACMRALRQTGWINFRMRAMLVSFASYHLWLHWREPALFLARQFLDYEPGIHYSQIQMQSGVTGINTVRIYSPIKQAQDQDPQGEFIRRYVPELEALPDHLLAEPHRMTVLEQSLYGCRLGHDYPWAIVDHATEYRAARDRIHAVKRSQEAREQAREVQRKLGSRRRPNERRGRSRSQ